MLLSKNFHKLIFILYSYDTFMYNKLLNLKFVSPCIIIQFE